MTKKEIVKHISEEIDVPQLKTKDIVQLVFDLIIQTLETEKRIELRNFGVFEVKCRKARKARNPRTGATVAVEPKNVVTFQPGKEMEEKIRQMALVPDKPRGKRRSRAPQVAVAASVGADNVIGGDGASAAAGAAATAEGYGNGDGPEAAVNGGKKKKVKAS